MLIDDDDYTGRRHTQELQARLAQLDRLIAGRPERAALLNERANLRSDLGDHQGALADYDRALELEPDHPALLYNRSGTRRDLGDIRGALADLDRSLGLDPDNLDGLVRRAGVREQLGDHQGALADYAAALALDPRSTLAWNNRGYLHMRLGRFDQALADLRAALELEPNDFTALCSMAEAFIALGQPDQGLDWLERAILLYPGARHLAQTSPDYDAVRDLPRFQALLRPQPARSRACLIARPSVDHEAVLNLAYDRHWVKRAEQPQSEQAPFQIVFAAPDTDTTVVYREELRPGFEARSFLVQGEDVEGLARQLFLALDLWTDSELLRLFDASQDPFERASLAYQAGLSASARAFDQRFFELFQRALADPDPAVRAATALGAALAGWPELRRLLPDGPL